jgi:hypothetical protein
VSHRLDEPLVRKPPGAVGVIEAEPFEPSLEDIGLVVLILLADTTRARLL